MFRRYERFALWGFVAMTLAHDAAGWRVIFPVMSIVNALIFLWHE
jgi:hypothetical protein